jgi:hypothetical protein
MADDYEYLSIDCPEGHGAAELTFYILDHISSSEKQQYIDQRAVNQVDCIVQSSLLRRGKKCHWSCRGAEEYKSLIERI